MSSFRFLGELQQLLQREGILISFSGKLSQGLIEEYGQAVKTYMEIEERPHDEVYNVFSIFIEQTQNIKNYCTRKRDSERYEQISQSCIVTIGRNEEGYYIWAGNVVEREDLAPIVSRLNEMSGLDKAGLKKLYKESLRRELPEGAGSAGLGLIDMARKANRPLEFSIDELDDGLSFITLKAVV